ncbi:MAG TPA: oligosaccharide flippase family protein [bacterium]|nr:oligosaccharide flippase family protein [bacterium]
MASLHKNTFYYALQTFAERVVSFFVLPLLTKMLPTEFYGVWTQVVVTATLFGGLLGFHSGVVRFLAGHKEPSEMGGFFHKILLVVLASSGLFWILSVVFADAFSKAMLGTPDTDHFISVFGAFVTTEILFELITAYLRAKEEIGPLSVYQFIKSVGRVGFLALGMLVLKTDLFHVVLWITIVQAALNAWVYARHIFPSSGVHFRSTSIPWREFLAFSLPLIPYGLLVWVNSFSDRYVILHQLDMKAVSVYAVTYSLAGTVSLLYIVLGFTIYPNIARMWNQGRKEEVSRKLSKASEYYVFFSVPCIVIFTFLHQPLVKFLTKTEFVSDGWVMFWLVSGIAAYGIYQLNYYVTLLANKTWINLIVLIFSSALNIGINLVIIPRVGIVGAAFTTFLSNAVLAFLTLLIVKKSVPYSFAWKAMPKILLSMAVLLGSLMLLVRLIEITGLVSLGFVGVLALAIYAAVDFAMKDSYLLQLKRGFAQLI